jgi:hypothetical protein
VVQASGQEQVGNTEEEPATPAESAQPVQEQVGNTEEEPASGQLVVSQVGQRAVAQEPEMQE